MPPRLAALAAVTLWGISFVATKAALDEISPVTLVFTRFVIGTLLLLAIVRELPPRDSWRQLALMGFVGIFVHQLTQSHALTLTTAVNTGWLIGLTPMWSAMLSAVALRERLGVWKIAGLVGGFAGALLVMTKGRLSAELFALPSTQGDLLVLATTVNWAVYSVLGHSTIRRLGARRATSGAMLFGTAMIAPFFFARAGWRELPALTATGWTAVLFLGVGCSALGYLFWYGALDRIEVSRVAAFLYLEPFVTFAAAVILLREPVSPTVAAGGVLVVISVLIAQYAPSPQRA